MNTITANAKSITIPFHRVGVDLFPHEGDLKETIKSCQKALDANKE
jgi:hypothetical protein